MPFNEFAQCRHHVSALHTHTHTRELFGGLQALTVSRLTVDFRSSIERLGKNYTSRWVASVSQLSPQLLAGN